MSARQDRIAAVKLKINEYAERERALPKAVCRACGGRVAAGEGERLPELAFDSPGARAEREHWLRSLSADVDGWRRTCPACVLNRAAGTEASAALFAVTGIRASEPEAAQVLAVLVEFDDRPDGIAYVADFVGRFRGGITAQAHGHATGKRWGHVTDDERERLTDAFNLLAARSLPGACAWGACGLCGRSTALGGWLEGPSTMTWPDGARAPICPVCAPVWILRGEPSDLDDVRRVGVECATGWPVALGTGIPSSFRLFAESQHADPAGSPDPWSWSDGLRDYIESVWTAHPEHAPVARRAEFEERRATERAARADEHRQEQEQIEAASW